MRNFGCRRRFISLRIVQYYPFVIGSGGSLTKNLVAQLHDFYYSAVVMGEHRLLGGFETLLLLAIMRLGDRAYGVTIRQELLRSCGSDIAVGAIYTGLGRLERKGLVESWHGEPTAERGGRAKRFYRVTATGFEVVQHKHRSMRGLLDGLDFAEKANA